jgi:hypothetical protein
VTGGGGASGSPFDVARQLHEVADRLLAGWTAAAGSVTSSGTGSLPERPVLPRLPATMSAAQVQAVLDELAARRAQVRALRDQLTSFDEQLGLLETGLRPVLEWTRTWADLEKSIESFWRLSDGRPGG